jgi:glycerophosphoryl diester phosphodiesterase
MSWLRMSGLWPLQMLAHMLAALVNYVLQGLLQLARPVSHTKEEGHWMKPAVTPGEVGHRGLRNEICPTGNTMSAFKESIRRGAKVIELDCRLTLCGQVVVHHDCMAVGILEDHVDIRGRAVEEITLAELQGMPFEKKADRSERCVTLRQVLELCTAHDLRILIETKDVSRPKMLIERIAELLSELDCEKRACIISFDPRSLWHARSMMPAVPTMMLYAPGLIMHWSAAGLERFHPILLPFLPALDRLLYWSASKPALLPRLLGVTSMGPKSEFVTKDMVDEAHAHGLAVYAWVVNTHGMMEKMESAGVDLVGTDTPGDLNANNNVGKKTAPGPTTRLRAGGANNSHQ